MATRSDTAQARWRRSHGAWRQTLDRWPLVASLTGGAILALAALITILAIAPGHAWPKLTSRDDAAARAQHCAGSVRFTPPRVGDVRAALANAIASRFDEADAGAIFDEMMACVGSEQALPRRAAQVEQAGRATVAAMRAAGFAAEATAAIAPLFAPVAQALRNDDVLAARQARRAMVARLRAIVIARDGAETGGGDTPWRASGDFTHLCAIASRDGGHDHSLCSAALGELRRAHSPCDLLDAPAQLTSAPCRGRGGAASTMEQASFAALDPGL